MMAITTLLAGFWLDSVLSLNDAFGPFLPGGYSLPVGEIKNVSHSSCPIWIKGWESLLEPGLNQRWEKEQHLFIHDCRLQQRTPIKRDKPIQAAAINILRLLPAPTKVNLYIGRTTVLWSFEKTPGIRIVKSSVLGGFVVGRRVIARVARLKFQSIAIWCSHVAALSAIPAPLRAGIPPAKLNKRINQCQIWH